MTFYGIPVMSSDNSLPCPPDGRQARRETTPGGYQQIFINNRLQALRPLLLSIAVPELAEGLQETTPGGCQQTFANNRIQALRPLPLSVAVPELAEGLRDTTPDYREARATLYKGVMRNGIAKKSILPYFAVQLFRT
jgi:hypothetical protein